MAITFTKQPIGIYPAYNNSYIEFTSSLVGDNKAVINVVDVGILSIYNSNSFTIYPNVSGKYLFNLKDIIKAKFNKYGFDDLYSETPTADAMDGFGESIEGTYLQQLISITVSNDSQTDTINKTYYFFKGVKQFSELSDEITFSPETQIINSNPEILNISENNIDFSLTYFEGFPFAFDIKRVLQNNEIVIKNLNTGVIADTLEANSNNAFRIYVDTGTINWNTTEFLPLTDTLNRLEIYKLDGLNNTSNKTNLNLKKYPSKCGVYLKWFNNQGGYSYWLFDEFTKYSLSAKDLKSVASNNFRNVNEGLVAPTKLIGKKGSESVRLKSRVDANEDKLIQSLFTSPSVQMYSSSQPYVNGKWINVEVSNKYENSNKKLTNNVEVTIDLPDLITPTL
ncbi:hypothetical protein [Cochleicola gelatinilyticus]|uniref:Uncharacterized protein n=1 Tax=Cochleicola gelatinilyticus TaxID=1763537 RepID=A0A167HN50_9FLAO|nr:hypothetical protein [Cochleicola gelatinilyticus]OAB78788.1 hypothetical protein ULVI_09405 [Cochleicola gelatinilyticus]